MKTLAWVENTRRAIKSYHGFGWSIQGIEKQNKVLTKFVYRFPTGQRTTVLTDIEWHVDNQKKIEDLVEEFKICMEEKHVDLKKAYELINGNKIYKNSKKINWEALTDEFINDERGNRRGTTKSGLILKMSRTIRALNTKPIPRNAEQLFKTYTQLFFN